MRRLNRWELGAAGALVVLGLYMIAEGLGYGTGTLRRMGPGFFPVAVGAVLALLGLGIAAEVRHSDTPPPELPLRPMAAVVGGLVAFALLVPRAGLVPATVVLVFVSAFADTRMTPTRAALAAIGIALLGWAVFILGFRLPLKPFWW